VQDIIVVTKFRLQRSELECGGLGGNLAAGTLLLGKIAQRQVAYCAAWLQKKSSPDELITNVTCGNANRKYNDCQLN
jgi:hypothetical protein